MIFNLLINLKIKKNERDKMIMIEKLLRLSFSR